MCVCTVYIIVYIVYMYNIQVFLPPHRKLPEPREPFSGTFPNVPYEEHKG